MSRITVRISRESQATLRRLAHETGESMQAILDKALEEYRRKCFLGGANCAYQSLRDVPKAWAEELAERKLWDSTLLDDLKES